MSTNVLGIGKSAVLAAQVGIATTGHNISNAATPGFNRQTLVQSAGIAQDGVGGGVVVQQINRIYNEFLAGQVRSAQSSKSSIDMYTSQISQIDNMFADPSAGLSPALQDFFKGVQDLSSNPNDAASRQAVLSTANELASRFQSIDGRLSELRQGANNQIASSVTNINTYATQIAQLNDAIALVSSNPSAQPNDLLDQRDQLVNELSTQVKVSILKQSDGTYNVSIGSGQPLVVGTKAYTLTTTTSPTDLSRTEVGFISNGATIALSEDTLTGGQLGGLLEFRAKTLDVAQNSLGLVAAGLASSFNAQHKLGQDQNGALGKNFFSVSTPAATPSVNNNVGTNASVTASISNAGLLTTSDYRLQMVGGNYSLLRLSDNTLLSNTTFAAAQAAAANEGFNFALASGSFTSGDSFVIKPTANAASAFTVAINNNADIAAAAPIRTGATLANTGLGTISAGAVDSTYTAATVTPPVTLTYNSGTNQLTGFPALMPVTVTNNGVPTVFAAGAPVTYTSGATISFGGVSFTLSGAVGNNDTFTVGPNTSGLGDNRNALLLGALQNANTLYGKAGGSPTATYQSAYAQLVGLVGNKARELQVTGDAGTKLLAQVSEAQQSESGVNLDEEASNLLRYQQAYQAAGKLMQVASTLFDVLLAIGH